ncbi:MAG: Smr/MutS family protein [Thermoanaerobaculia bacterium]
MSDRDESERAERLWRKAAEGAQPLAPTPDRVRRRRPRSMSPTGEPGPRFRLDSWGEHCEGRAASGGEEALDRIHRGEWPVDLRLDLHGLTAEQARDELRAMLRRALRAGLTGVLVVHGRGAGSAAGPILKESLPEWLAAAPHGSRVLAFSTVGPHGGRGGATLVALSSGL